EARNVAQTSVTDCTAAAAAADKAATGIYYADQTFAAANAAITICEQLGHLNLSAAQAADFALAAKQWLLQGQAQELACSSCCTLNLANPSNLHGTATNPTSVRLTWKDNHSEPGFEIQRSTNAGPFTLIATTGANVAALMDGGGNAANGNRYRVRAVSADCSLQSPWSALAAVPRAPTNLTGTRGAGAILDLAW